MYFVLGVLFLFLVWREIEHGPGEDPGGIRQPRRRPEEEFDLVAP
jgi:hypothetical protein